MKYLILIFAFLAVIGTQAQDRVITGEVYDDTGEPCIGASVKVIDTTKGVITDFDGKFSVGVDKKAKAIEVSYIGCATQIVELTKENHYVIRLKSAEIKMEEIVVIGYGSVKRGDVTNAIASLSGDEIDDRQNENALQSIQGRLAGVEITNGSGAPGGEMEVHVRGAASINANDQPLYVVDGIPVDDISDLNPNDIASIDVLKDASSSAIYGSRGANGVILIKTRTADKKEKLTVQLSAAFGLQHMEKKLDVLSPSEWIEWRSSYNNQKYVEQYGYLGATANDDYETRLAYTGGSVNTRMVNDPRWSMPNYGGLMAINWQDEVFRTAPKQTYNVAIAYASDKSDCRVSLGYTDQEGIAINTSYQRLNLRASFNTKINNHISAGMNIAPSVSWNNGASPEAVGVLTMVPLAESEAGIYTGAEPYTRYNWAGSRVSPVAVMEQTSKTTEDTRLMMSAYVKAEIIKGLNVEITGSYTYRDQQLRLFTPSSISNRWNTGEGYYANANRTDSRSHKYLVQAVANYNKKFGANKLDAMMGISFEGATSYSSRLAATHFPDNLIEDFDMGDVDLTSAYASTGYPQRMASVFGRIQYDYGNRYLVTLSLRRDGSSKFGKNNRWGVFPSVSAAYRISNESFWPEDLFMNSMKLRLSWGANGNNSLSDGAAMGLMSSANYSTGGTLHNGYAPASLNVDDLTWEKVYSWDTGFDAGFLNNRIQLSFDFYYKTTSSLLYKVTMPGVIGFSSMWDNVGEIKNKGVELELNTINLSGKKYKWTTSFNMSYNQNEVSDLGDNDVIFSNSNTQVLMVGQPMRSFYMYDAVGVYQTKEDLLRYPTRKGTQLGDVRYRDVNDDGVIDDNDRTLVGKPDPNFVFGLTNKLMYKDFDLSLLFTAQFGGYLYSMSPGRYCDNPGMAYSQNVFSWWKNMWRSEEEPGDGKTPALESTTGELRDTRWLYHSDYIRLKNITLGYRLPIKKKMLRSVRAYLSIENIWMWDKYEGGYSPENKGNNIYPQAITYTLGVNVSI